jgi:hypothetical protein
MKAKQFLVTVYFDEPDTTDKFVLDKNTADDYDYDLCITKVISTHLVSVNDSDVRVVDVAVDTQPERIKQLVGSK